MAMTDNRDHVKQALYGFLGLLAVSSMPSASYAVGTGEGPMGWSGYYAGGTLGLAKGDVDLEVSGQNTNNYFNAIDRAQIMSAGSTAFNPTDFSADIFIGHNWQQGNWVYGIQADLTLARFDESHNTPYTSFTSAPAQSFRMETRVQSDWNAKLLLRLGYAKNDSLYYLSAGPALTKVRYDFEYQDRAVNNEYSRLSTNKLARGWSAGLGMEHKLKDDWAMRADLSYTYFSDAVDKSSNLKNWADGFRHDVDFGIVNAQIGLVKQF